MIISVPGYIPRATPLPAGTLPYFYMAWHVPRGAPGWLAVRDGQPAPGEGCGPMKTLIDLGSNERWMASINSAGRPGKPHCDSHHQPCLSRSGQARIRLERRAGRIRRSQRQVYFLDTASRYSRVRTEEFTVLTQRSRCHQCRMISPAPTTELARIIHDGMSLGR